MKRLIGLALVLATVTGAQAQRSQIQTPGDYLRDRVMQAAPVSHFSASDRTQLMTDLRVIGSDTELYRTSLTIAERLKQCHEYWERNIRRDGREPVTRGILGVVRIQRCMYRTGYWIPADRCRVATRESAPYLGLDEWQQVALSISKASCYTAALSD